MDYSDLMSSVVNENENLANVAMAGKQIIAGKDESIGGILTDVGTPVGTALLAAAGWTKDTWVGNLKSAVNSATTDASSASSASSATAAVPTVELTDMASDAAASAAAAAGTAGADAAALAAQGAGAVVSTAITESGIAAVVTPVVTEAASAGLGLGLAGIASIAVPVVGVVAFLGSVIGSAVEAFESHHETDSASVNLGDLTSLAFDPSSS